METWLFILLIFILLIIFLIFIVWIDWKFKCRKTIRENKLIFYAVGYTILKVDENVQNILIIDGLLGVNSSELVFGNRFQDDSLYLKEELTNICSFNVSEYNENDFLGFIHNNSYEKDVKTKYIIRNMAGLSASKRIPKLIKTRKICKIAFTNNVDFYFCYKNTIKNAEAIENLKMHTYNKKC
ncbi:hypothetical protein [Pseudobacteroides cellulosolvens]|uniref:Uncharacterized protein n=1 Tax=Pseudobacteroides cellulosolvens ATCC 35603 = DSM 2933 TaxID=398512 RepID=A0A0L6JP30_9FIRM|nr:hypothetical protein [Pseudobacteroides cellulosolvens]KNY27596.1 hypothetical protein Bccel_2867 [Pseudobacteroides cellulosolvens ATCC 35603 = DSM 2933]